MARNTGKGRRIGAVRRRSQLRGPSGKWIKRGPGGRFLNVKADSASFKGVRRER